MVDILVLPLPFVSEIKLGDIVSNFGVIARVVGPAREYDGFFLLREIGAEASAGQWYADPAKCRTVR